jgi:hypothetical protein
MAKLAEYLGKINFEDKNFLGTIALRSEEITLPDGSKMALGIDDGHWVLVYQEGAGKPFRVFEYDQQAHKIHLDTKPVEGEAFQQFKKLVNYFVSSARTEDLITILPA